jgi:hypothetical protein
MEDGVFITVAHREGEIFEHYAIMTVLKIPMQQGKKQIVARKPNSPTAQAA